jgi:hypothetical protein
VWKKTSFLTFILNFLQITTTTSALNIILKSLNDVDSISELQIANLEEKIKIIPLFDAASLYIETTRQMNNKIAIEYLSVYRQTSKLTIGKLCEVHKFTIENLLTSFVLAGN